MTAPTAQLARIPCPEPEIHVITDSPLPHASWIVGLYLLVLVAGVALGAGLATYWG